MYKRHKTSVSEEIKILENTDLIKEGLIQVLSNQWQLLDANMRMTKQKEETQEMINKLNKG